MGMKTKIDLKQLALEIRNLNRSQKLYEVLRTELTRIDHWKQSARGNPKKANSMIKNRKF